MAKDSCELMAPTLYEDHLEKFIRGKQVPSFTNISNMVNGPQFCIQYTGHIFHPAHINNSLLARRFARNGRPYTEEVAYIYESIRPKLREIAYWVVWAPKKSNS